MGVKEAIEVLKTSIQKLRVEFDSMDFTKLKDDEEIDELLDKIVDVNIRIQQFKSRYGYQAWTSWGHSLWNDLERNWLALERKLARIRNEKLRDKNEALEKDRRKSLLFTLIIALSAAISCILAFVQVIMFK